jgi:nicotinamide-nucleotide amidase
MCPERSVTYVSERATSVMASEQPCLPPSFTRPANRIVKLLAAKKLTIVTAESCTAGLIAAALSKPEGASDVLQGGFVVYTKQQKTTALGVPASQLKRDGSVTAKVAEAMARGALKHSGADIAIAVTGVLGPEPDEDGNPVGLVYFCCARRSGTVRCLRKAFPKLDHDRLCAKTVTTAFDLVAEAVSAGQQ